MTDTMRALVDATERVLKWVDPIVGDNRDLKAAEEETESVKALKDALARSEALLAGREGWKPWEGGDMPVPPDALLEVQIGCDAWTEQRNGAEKADWFESLGWWDDRGRNKVRIKAYRLAPPPPTVGEGE